MTLFLLITLCVGLGLVVAFLLEDNSRLRSRNTVQAIALAAARRPVERDDPWRPLPPWAVRHTQPALPAASQPALPAAEPTGDLLAVPFLTEPPPPADSGWIPHWRNEDGWIELTDDHFDRDDRPRLRLPHWPGAIAARSN